MRILVIMPGCEEYFPPEELGARRECLERYASPGTEVHVGFLDAGCAPISTAPTPELGEALIAPSIVRRARAAEAEGYDAIMVHCMYDPGVEAARGAVRIPVVGPGRASFHLAAMVVERIGVIEPSDHLRSLTYTRVRQYGMEPMVAYIGAINVPRSQIRERREEVKRRFLSLSQEALRAGAQLIVSTCLADVPVHVSAVELQAELGAPVLDGDAIGVRTAETLAALGLSRGTARATGI